MVKSRKLSASFGDEEKIVDRISMLPDELIHDIMSFIDTKYAVQTCVLSKRWIDVWKSLPFLNFDIHGYRSIFKVKQSERVEDFINNAIILRDNYNIQWFRLRWFYYTINNGVRKSLSRWIDVSVEHNVQEVTLELRQRSSCTYEIPPRLLNCISLKRLELIVNKCVHINLPESMSLPQLLFMHLEGLSVYGEESTKRLLSGCPLLETLNIVDCDIIIDDKRSLSLESPSLKQFAHTNHEQHNIYRGHHLKHKIIKLSAPNLISFTCKSFLTQDYDLQNCSGQISDANLNILYNNEFEKKQLSDHEKEVYVIRIMELLVAVRKVKRLELSSGFLEVLWRAADSINCQFPWLCNLQSLRVESRFTRGSLRSIAYLLTISPNVKSIKLEPNKSYSPDVGDDWEEGFSLPGMLSHLNIVRIENVDGCDAEFKILSFLLKNAKVLKEVALYPACSSVKSPSRLRKQFKNKLRALPRASSDIKMRWGETGSTFRI
ncbi:putative F-box/FBD/LRR-repeat protein At1g78760 [Papaver somniferum]|uniref:putative F-box/FBD/LRR-repeat protein At1g78760 n=1 Tax=Papaver somniferum TaxID=3469 RepID=UPI000E6FB801|nr:putative F-box/FBD/LRR-repeat protein At1g78760 [Papaver somniferum]